MKPTFAARAILPGYTGETHEPYPGIVRPIFRNREYDIEIEIDADEIAREWGERAAKSKSRKARAMGGLVTIRVSPR